jgi:cysteine desulfurase
MIYLDNQATTPVDPAVLQAMLPLWTEHFANPGSITHAPGRVVAQMVQHAIHGLASLIGAESDELVITSGATESNNLAIFGVALHPRQSKRRVVSVATEHRALLDPLVRLERLGFEVVRIPVRPQGDPWSGSVDLDSMLEAITEQTALVSIMLANNEIGTIQPIEPIAQRCQALGVWLHTDATQAVGKMPVDVQQLGVDLLSFSGHKFYGPRGIGGLYVRRSPRAVRLYPQIVGGGQQHHQRSGTLNAPGIVGMHNALSLCHEHAQEQWNRYRELRDRLWNGLKDQIPELVLNGPSLEAPGKRLGLNLNCQFPNVEGQSLMLEIPELAVSSGSACTSADPHPSHVLAAIGLSEDQARCSLRFGVGRFNQIHEIDRAIDQLSQAYRRLRRLLSN